MGIWPFARSGAQEDAESLLAAVQTAARRPALYGPGRTPDTLEGRFELMTLFASLALIRLRADPEAERLAQLFTDKLFRQFDAGLREAGVGDLTVPKKMRRLAGEFYGRLEAYADPLAAGDGARLAEAIARNLDVDPAFAATLAGQAMALSQTQAGAGLGPLLTADGWAAPLT